MKNLILLKLCGFLIMFLPLLAKAQFTDTREIRKTFRVTQETQIEISNKYGKIEINTWDKDSVKFNINIRVEEKKLSKLEESINGIDFDITNNDHYLIVRTDVEKNKSGLSREIKKFKETLLSSDGNIQVDYTVWMPDSNNLKVENKFGDIYIGDYKGEIDINLSNGNLKAHNFENGLTLTLNFADVTINSISTGRLDCNFSDLYIKNIGSAKIKSKSTEFELQKAANISATSRRDKFRIREIDLFDARSTFTTYRINELTDRAKIQAEYGDIEIENAATDFSNINIETKSTDINLYFNRETAFNFTIKNTKANIDFGSEFNIVKEDVLDDKEKEVNITGKFGEPTEEAVKLNINANSGTINLRSTY